MYVARPFFRRLSKPQQQPPRHVQQDGGKSKGHHGKSKYGKGQDHWEPHHGAWSGKGSKDWGGKGGGKGKGQKRKGAEGKSDAPVAKVARVD